MNQLLSFIDCRVQFEKPEGCINESIAFQLSLSIHAAFPWTFSKLVISFTNPQFDQCFSHSTTSPSASDKSQLIECSRLLYTSIPGVFGCGKQYWTTPIDLTMNPNTCKTIQSTVISSDSQEVQIKMGNS